MKRILCVLLAVSAFVAVQAADNRVPFYDKVTSDQYSPRNDMIVQQFFEREHDQHQIWLVSAVDPSQRHLLFAHERDAEVIFSADEKWLAINNHYASDGATVLLFRQKGPLEYEQANDLEEAAWKFFDQQNGRTKPNKFDHSYLNAVSWADDDPPHTLLLCLDGHGGSSGGYAGPWYCLFDTTTKEFSVDFAAHNKSVTKLPAE